MNRSRLHWTGHVWQGD